METGWTRPDGAAELPLTAALLAMRQREPGDPLAVARARGDAADALEARAAAEVAPDPDERASAMVARGYSPGLISVLTQRIQATENALSSAREKNEKHGKVAARVGGMLERREIGAVAAALMLDESEGPGDLVPPNPGPVYNRHPAVAPYAREEIQRMTGPAGGCGQCAQYGATPAESAKIHAGVL